MEKKKIPQLTHVCNIKWRFANGKPFIFSERDREGLGNVRDSSSSGWCKLLNKQEGGS